MILKNLHDKMLNITKIIILWIWYWLYIQLKQFSQKFVSQKPCPVEGKKDDYKELRIPNETIYPCVLYGLLVPLNITLCFMKKVLDA